MAEVGEGAPTPIVSGRGFRVAVADEDASTRRYYETVLADLGHEVVVSAGTGRELCEGCVSCRPDIAITDVRLPVMDGIDAALAVCRVRPIPFIVVTELQDPELIVRAQSDHITAYLAKPLERRNFEPTLRIAMFRFWELQAFAKESLELRQALRDRKDIERAKGILMKETGLDENQAFRRLQRLASERNMKLAEIARTILVAKEALERET